MTFAAAVASASTNNIRALSGLSELAAVSEFSGNKVLVRRSSLQMHGGTIFASPFYIEKGDMKFPRFIKSSPSQQIHLREKEDLLREWKCLMRVM